MARVAAIRVGDVLRLKSRSRPPPPRHRVERSPHGPLSQKAHAVLARPAGRSRAAAPPPPPPQRGRRRWPAVANAHSVLACLRSRRSRRRPTPRQLPLAPQPAIAPPRRRRAQHHARCWRLRVAPGSTSTDAAAAARHAFAAPRLAPAVVAQLLSQLVPGVADAIHRSPTRRRTQHQLEAAVIAPFMVARVQRCAHPAPAPPHPPALWRRQPSPCRSAGPFSRNKKHTSRPCRAMACDAAPRAAGGERRLSCDSALLARQRGDALTAGAVETVDRRQSSRSGGDAPRACQRVAASSRTRLGCAQSMGRRPWYAVTGSQAPRERAAR